MAYATRERVPYFNVPASLQPLRVREATRRAPRPTIEPTTNVLEQLAVVPHGPGQIAGMCDQDRQEAHDATWECRHGRLPSDHTPPCGCWPQEPAPEISLPEMSPEPVPDLIPDWVLADARDMHRSGLTLQRIARAILPATGCPDVPGCEQLLKLRLQTRD